MVPDIVVTGWLEDNPDGQRTRTRRGAFDARTPKKQPDVDWL